MVRISDNVVKTIIISSSIAAILLMFGLLLGYLAGVRSNTEKNVTYFETEEPIWPEYYLKDSGNGNIDTVFVYKLKP